MALRLKVSSIVSDEQFGRFSLQANQVAPFNAFINLASCRKRAAQTNRANLLLWSRAVEPARPAQHRFEPLATCRCAIGTA